jgi:TRAP-type C4-dicarboxylate transport system permease small subunit
LPEKGGRRRQKPPASRQKSLPVTGGRSVNLLKKVDSAIIKLLKILSSACLAAMVVLVCLEVVFRYFLKIPCAWAEELARLSLVWCVVLASGVGIRLYEHPYIEVLVKRFPDKIQKILQIIIYLIIAAFGVVLIIYGAMHTYSTRMDFMTSLGYHKNYFYVPSVVAGVLYCAYSLVDVVKTTRELLSKGGGDK